MAKQTRSALQSMFVSGTAATEQKFEDLLDSFHSVRDDSVIMGPSGVTGLSGMFIISGASAPTSWDGSTGSTGQVAWDGTTLMVHNGEYWNAYTGSTSLDSPAIGSGATGADGATGPTGADGATGATGSDGPTGADGATGAPGSGATGITAGNGITMNPDRTVSTVLVSGQAGTAVVDLNSALFLAGDRVKVKAVDVTNSVSVTFSGAKADGSSTINLTVANQTREFTLVGLLGPNTWAITGGYL